MQTTLVQLTGKGANPKTTLYVGGLEETANEATLHAAFLPFGDITDVSVPMDHATGKHRGFGFVQYESADDAADAIDNMHNAGRCQGTPNACPCCIVPLQLLARRSPPTARPSLSQSCTAASSE